jgi:hypothetical protein
MPHHNIPGENNIAKNKRTALPSSLRNTLAVLFLLQKIISE